jgi:hypothetical protein
MQPIILQNENLRMEFSPTTGALTAFTARQTGWKILDRAALGLSFRLLVPLSEALRNNPVYGEKQALAKYVAAADGRSATFTWDGVESERGGRLDIRLELTVSLDAAQAVFAMTVENRSAYTVENVYCPYLGDVQHPADEEWFKTFIYTYATANEWRLWPHYDNLRGYYGVDYPTQFHPGAPFSGTPMSPFFLLRGEKQGLYAGAVSSSTEYVAWHTELRPGYGSSIDARVPEVLEISGKEVATRFAAIHVPYLQPGETRSLTPIALQPYQGGWQQGCDIYKRWRDTWFKTPPLPKWASEPHAWQQIHINSPEDELRVRFTDLPKIGAECARHGVKAIQLVGWNDGGQDQGNPSHSPDPRLGTFEELKEAIRQVQALGVKIILFSKYTWADRGTQWFRSELHRLAVKDPYGDYYLHPGYQYQTATQLLDINTKRLIPMCFSSEEYLALCSREFQKTVDLGADGILFDECLHHGPAVLCFDPNHGHRYGAPVFANDRKLIHNFHAVSDPLRQDFLFAGEACYDWEMDAYHLSYHRSENKHHIPLSRYLLPHGQFMTAVTGFADRSMINQCLLDRYIISYEPYNFKGHLDDYPLTMDYGRQMDALRTELREYFWDGEFRDTVGALVKNGEKPHHPFTVFLSAKTGQPGLVICNYSEKETITLSACKEDGNRFDRYRLVDDAQWKPAGEAIIIPPQSAAVVI